MGIATPVAVAASIPQAGFGVASSIAKGQQERAAANMRANEAEMAAQRAERAAEFGRVQADQTDVSHREEPATVLANIDAQRASSGLDPTSPTGIALKERETEVSDRDRRNRVTGLRLQAEEDERQAAYGRSVATYQRAVGRSALKLSYFNAGASLAGGAAGIASAFGGASGGGFTPYQRGAGGPLVINRYG
ncbi:MAG: hypothetical protein FJX65_18835 [Alphaproteobacteria bacterium]|nr:hypothetical protein [Alphaproteobacteria bacterium]